MKINPDLPDHVKNEIKRLLQKHKAAGGKDQLCDGDVVFLMGVTTGKYLDISDGNVVAAWEKGEGISNPLGCPLLPVMREPRLLRLGHGDRAGGKWRNLRDGGHPLEHHHGVLEAALARPL